MLRLDITAWNTDPRRLVADAEKAGATTLSAMMGMTAPMP